MLLRGNARRRIPGLHRAFGATVIQRGRDFDAARGAAEAYAAQSGGFLLVDGTEGIVGRVPVPGALDMMVARVDGRDDGPAPVLLTGSNVTTPAG